MLPEFVAGVNVPWINYAKDSIRFSIRSEYIFKHVLSEIQSSGGNAIRWWLHTNGKKSPSFSNGKVVGICENTIKILKKILDIAEEKGLYVSVCLWSFDMLQEKQGQDLNAMKDLLEKDSYLQHYIDNALIPILEEVGGHPAILTWEIFNEPEGMSKSYGWTSTRVEMLAIQKTINRLAAVIHKHACGVPVSNGSWAMKASTDVGGSFNYYRDDRLIKAGGESDGYLDLYQIHYYPKNFKEDLSPFHNPASYWCLDKPIIIGEFPNNGCLFGKPSIKKNTAESFKYLYENGYQGGLTWKWPYEVDMGSFELDAIPGLKEFSGNANLLNKRIANKT